MFLVVVFVFLSFSVAVPPRKVDFDFSVPPGEGVWSVVNRAEFSNKELKLNYDTPNVNAAAYFATKVWVDNFKVNFTFTLTDSPNGHNGGMAFVIQDDSVTKAGPNNAGLGYGSEPDSSNIGLTNSIVVEFDTFFDPGVDDTLDGCQTPHFAIHSKGATANSAVEKTANVGGCYKSFNDPYSPSQLGKIHLVKVWYEKPYLSVFYDEAIYPLLNVSYDIPGTLGLTDSEAYFGFTAATGPDGGDVHSIHSTAFEYISTLAAGSSKTDEFPATITAGNNGTFLIQAIDNFGHPYPFGGATVSVKMANAVGDQFTHHFVDYNNGTYKVTFNCTLASDDQMTIELGGAPISGSPLAITINAAAVDATLGQVNGDVTYARAGVPASVEVLVFDRFENPTDASCDFTGTKLVGAPGSITLSTPTTPSKGTWAFTYTATTVGEYVWTIMMNTKPIGKKNAPANLFVSNGPASAANSTVNGLSSNFEVGHAQSFTVAVFDGSNNRFTGNVSLVVSIAQGDKEANVTLLSKKNGEYEYSFVVYQTGQWQPSVQIAGDAVTTGVPSALQVSSGPLSAQKSLIEYGGVPIQHVAGPPGLTTTLTAKDIYGNTATQKDGISWTVTVNGENYIPKESLVNPGVYEVDWNPTVVGTYVMTALLGKSEIKNSGKYSVVVSANPNPWVEYTQLVGDGAKNAQVGVEESFFVVVEDAYHNQIKSKVNISCEIFSAAKEYAEVSLTFNAGNGTWTVSYLCPSTGTYSMKLFVAQQLYGGGALPIVVSGLLSAGAIAGIVLGCIAAVALIVGVIFIWRRKKRVYQAI